jgi:hypothetical protein
MVSFVGGRACLETVLAVVPVAHRLKARLHLDDQCPLELLEGELAFLDAGPSKADPRRPASLEDRAHVLQLGFAEEAAVDENRAEPLVPVVAADEGEPAGLEVRPGRAATARHAEDAGDAGPSRAELRSRRREAGAGPIEAGASAGVGRRQGFRVR